MGRFGCVWECLSLCKVRVREEARETLVSALVNDALGLLASLPTQSAGPAADAAGPLALVVGLDVITSVFSYSAAAAAIVHAGCAPLFVDINPDTLQGDEDQATSSLGNGLVSLV